MKMKLEYSDDRDAWVNPNNIRILFCHEVMAQLGLTPYLKYEMQVETVPIEGGIQVELSRGLETEWASWDWIIEGVTSESANIFCTSDMDRMTHFLFPTKRNGTVWIKFTEIA